MTDDVILAQRYTKSLNMHSKKCNYLTKNALNKVQYTHKVALNRVQILDNGRIRHTLLPAD